MWPFTQPSTKPRETTTRGYVVIRAIEIPFRVNFGAIKIFNTIEEARAAFKSAKADARKNGYSWPKDLRIHRVVRNRDLGMTILAEPVDA